MRLASSYRWIGLFVLASGLVSPAWAQDAKVEVSGGYSLLGLKSGIEETLEKGWYAELSGHFTRNLEAVFQVTGNYKTFEETFSFGGVTSRDTLDLKIHEFVGGVRVHAHVNRTVAPFAHVLIGAANGSEKYEGTVTGAGQTFFSSSSGDSSTDFTTHVGGGTTFWLRPKFGVRGMVDYIRVFSSDSDDLNAFRVSGGAVIGF